MLLLGFTRVYIFGSSIYISFTISIALYVIVCSSVVIGTILPMLLHNILHIDAAHSGPIAQVIMDVSGVALTCIICQVML